MNAGAGVGKDADMTMPSSVQVEQTSGVPLVLPPPVGSRWADVWFLNVGNGDCSLIVHPDGRVTLIDLHLRQSIGGQVAEVAAGYAGLADLARALKAFQRGVDGKLRAVRVDDPAEFLERLGVREVFRLVMTHPDMDHLRGLAKVMARLPVRNVWDTHNLKWIPVDGFGREADTLDWLAYQVIRSGLSGSRVLRLTEGDRGHVWAQDGITVLAPSLVDVCEAHRLGCWNRISYVVRFALGRSSVVFAGDAETPTLDRVARKYGDVLKSSILKAPHHGRWSGWSAEFVTAVAPSVTVISSGPKAPVHDAARAYKLISRVVSTQTMGTVGYRMFEDGSMQPLTAPSRENAGEEARLELLGLLCRTLR